MACEPKRYIPAELTAFLFRACPLVGEEEQADDWSLLEQDLSITPPNPSTDTVDYTVKADKRKRKRGGIIIDEGQVKVKFQFNPANASHIAFFAAFYSQDPMEFGIAWELPEGDTPIADFDGPKFAGFIQALAPNSLEQNNDLEYEATVEIDGEVDWDFVMQEES